MSTHIDSTALSLNTDLQQRSRKKTVAGSESRYEALYIAVLKQYCV